MDDLRLSCRDLCPDTYTAGYVTLEDLKAISKLARDSKNRDAVIELGKKIDVFATGMVIYYAIERKSPYEMDPKGNPFLAQYRDCQHQQVPPELNALLKQMVDPNPENRPTRIEAFQKFDDLVAKKYPDIHTKIQKVLGKDFELPR